ASAPPLCIYAFDVTDTLFSAATVLVAACSRSQVVVGLAAGAIPLFNYRIAPLALLALSSRRAVVAACVPLALLAVFNILCVGAPWRVGQMYVGGEHPWAQSLNGL